MGCGRGQGSAWLPQQEKHRINTSEGGARVQCGPPLYQPGCIYLATSSVEVNTSVWLFVCYLEHRKSEPPSVLSPS